MGRRYSITDIQEYVPTPWQTCIVYWVSLALSLLINLYFNRHLDKLNTVCLYWTAGSVIMCVSVWPPVRIF